MKNQNTRRGYTQQYFLLHLREKVTEGRMRGNVGQAGPALQPCGAGSDNAPAKGHTTSFTSPLRERMGAAQVRGKWTSAFTLIELLVVVLIIGILAAVAVPQYNKAVWKSRVTQALLFISNIEKAGQAYVLANGYPVAEEDPIELLGANSPLDLDFFPTEACDEGGNCSDNYFTYYAEVYSPENSPSQLEWSIYLKEDPMDSYASCTIKSNGTRNCVCSYSVSNMKTVCDLLDSLSSHKYTIHNVMD